MEKRERSKSIFGGSILGMNMNDSSGYIGNSFSNKHNNNNNNNQTYMNTQRNSILQYNNFNNGGNSSIASYTKRSRAYSRGLSPKSSIMMRDEEILDDESIIDIQETKDDIEVRKRLKEFIYYQNKLQRQNTFRELQPKLSTNSTSDFTNQITLRKNTSTLDLRKLHPHLLQAVLERDYMG